MNRNRLLLIFAWLCCAGLLFAQTLSYPGELGVGDAKLGKYFDTYSLQLSAGDRVVATLTSPDFDTYLIIESPDGRELENDDFEDGDFSRLDVLVDRAGEWKVKVTSYEDDEQGEYLLLVNREKLRHLETFEGVLDENDPASIKDERYDRYTLRLQERQRVLIRMESDEVDSFLVLKPPRGRTIGNDDYGDGIDSRIDTVAEAGGTYELYATTNAGGETGSYVLRIFTGGLAGIDRREGRLVGPDSESAGESYYEDHAVQLTAGAHVIVEMVSADFDTFLEVMGPGDYYDMNDDYGGSTAVSRLELFAPEAGEYVFTASAYEDGAAGAYSLTIYTLP